MTCVLLISNYIYINAWIITINTTVQLNPYTHYRSGTQYMVVNIAEQLSKMLLTDPISPVTRQNQNLLTDTYIQIYHITFNTVFLENYM